MHILGISAYYHDSAASIVVDGIVVSAAAEERFSRCKHDKRFPLHAIAYCLTSANLSIEDVDIIVFYEKPFLKFERILMTHIQNAPRSLKPFLLSMPIWIKERINLSRTINNQLKKHFLCRKKFDIRYIEHHISHAAMAFFPSGFQKAAILVIDAVGEKATTSILHGGPEGITLIKQQVFPNSVGLLYSAFTYFLGFKVNSDEYKVMGLAPYGKLNDPQTQKFIQIIEQELVSIDKDGSILLNQRYFTFQHRLTMVDLEEWERLFGIQHREPNTDISSSHKNLATAIQYVAEKIILRLVKHIKSITQEDNLCISGGCALNCAIMGKIKNNKFFQNIFIPYAPGDDGCAIGAAIAFNKLANPGQVISPITPYTGPAFSDNYIIQALHNLPYHIKKYSEEELYQKTAMAIANGMIVGWFQGKMEFGPRALGNRSILTDARNPMMKDILNRRVKFRESFRPFAPITLEEDVSKYFYSDISPYMMFIAQVKHTETPLPAITHLDNTARVQTISFSQNQRMYRLLKAFKKQTGCAVLLNTSFNVMGEPIVCNPYEAINTFAQSGMDVLVMNNFIISKQ